MLRVVTALAALVGAAGGGFAAAVSLSTAREVSEFRAEVRAELGELRGEVRALRDTVNAHVNAPGLHP